MKAYGEWKRSSIHSYARHYLASRPRRFTQGKISPTHWIGGWVVPRTRLEPLEYRENSLPCREMNPGSHSPQPVIIASTLSIPAPSCLRNPRWTRSQPVSSRWRMEGPSSHCSELARQAHRTAQSLRACLTQCVKVCVWQCHGDKSVTSRVTYDLGWEPAPRVETISDQSSKEDLTRDMDIVKMAGAAS
jgi:hypothetical protein